MKLKYFRLQRRCNADLVDNVRYGAVQVAAAQLTTSASDPGRQRWSIGRWAFRRPGETFADAGAGQGPLACDHPDATLTLALIRLCSSDCAHPTMLIRPCSSDRALVVLEHERRLDHVRQCTHLHIAKHDLEEREDALRGG